MAPQTGVTITQLEPAVFLRGQSSSGEDGRGRRRHINLDAPPSQLRALLTLTLAKPSKIKDISISLTGVARTDWPEGIGPNRLELSEESRIIKEVVTLFNAKREKEAAGVGRRRRASVGEVLTGRGTASAHLDSRPTSSGGSAHLGPGHAGNGSSGTSSAPAQLANSLQAASLSADGMQLGQNGVGRLGAARGFDVSPSRGPSSMVRSHSAGSDSPSRSAQASLANDRYLSPLEKGLLKLSNLKAKDKQKGKARDTSEHYYSGDRSHDGARSLPTSRPQTPGDTTVNAPMGGARGDYFGTSAPSSSSNVPWEDPPMYTYYPPTPSWQASGASAHEGAATTSPQPIPEISTPPSDVGSRADAELTTTAATTVSDGNSASGSKPTSPAPQRPRSPLVPSSPAAPETVWAAGPGGKSILHHNSAQIKGKAKATPRSEQVRFDPSALVGAIPIESDFLPGGVLAPPPGGAAAPIAQVNAGVISTPVTVSGFSANANAADASHVARGPGSPEMSRQSSAAGTSGLSSKNNSPPRAGSAPVAGTSTSSSSLSKASKDKGGLKSLLSGLNHDHGKGKEKEKEKGEKKGLSVLSSPRDAVRKDSRDSKDLARADKEHDSADWKEFKAGTYTFPICIPLPSNLPPTLHADFGSNQYILKALVQRSGPLTPNLTCEREVTFIHAPDEDEMEGTDAIVVQRTWEDALSYVVVISGKSFPLGSKIPIWLKFVPLTKVRIHRIVATMEEKTDYFAKNKRVARHEVPRRWNLLKLANANQEPLLPLLDDAPDALAASALGPFVAAAAEDPLDAMPSMLDPNGPWELLADLDISLKKLTRINLSSNHKRSNIAVHHMLRLTIRVERDEDGQGFPQDGKRKLFDIVIEAPISLNHSYTNDAWIKLPNYALARDDVSPGAAAAAAAAAADDDGGSPRNTRPQAVLRAFNPTAIRTLPEQRSPGIPRTEPLSHANLGTQASGSSRQLTRRWLALSETAGRFGARLELPGERPNQSPDDPLPTSEPPPPSYQAAVFSRPVLAHPHSDEAVAQQEDSVTS